MIQHLKWSERKFVLDFPVGLMPQFIERLRGTPARVEELCRGLQPAVLTRRLDGKWSIQENIGHLIQVERLHDGRIDDFRKRASTLGAANLQNPATEAADYNAQSIASIMAEFRKARTNFIRRIEEFPDDLVGHVAMHPRLNVPMRLVDMLYFVGEHDDFHFAVAVELLRRQGGTI